MKRIISKPLITNRLAFLGLLMVLLCSSCDNDLYNDFSDVTVEQDSYVPNRNTTIAEAIAMYKPGGYVIPKTGKEYIIEGRVISNDYDGNFYTEMFIQDETGGIKISIGMASLYATYPVGSLVAVKLNGLKLGAYGGLVSIGIDTDRTSASGSAYENDRIPFPLVDEYLFGPGNMDPVKPWEVRFSELNQVPDGVLIRLNDVQFIDSELEQPWADASDPNNKQTVNRHLEQEGETGRLIVRSSGYARFANDLLPQGKGYIIGILTRFRGTPQLIINSPSQFEMNGARFGNVAVEVPEANTTIAKLRNMLDLTQAKTKQTIDKDLVLSATVVSDDSHGQFYKRIYVQDEGGHALALLVNMKNSHLEYAFGTKLLIRLKGLVLGAEFGALELGVESDDSKFLLGLIPEDQLAVHLLKDGQEEVEAKEMNISDLTKEMSGTLVKIKGLSAKKSGEPWNNGDNNVVSDIFTDIAGQMVEIRVSKYSDFAKEKQPSGQVSITGVLSFFKDKPQLTIASTDAVVAE